MAAQNKPAAHSPTDAPPTAFMPSSISTSSTYLGVPIAGGRLARSSSHDSFATDVSLLSLSSFTSEIPTRVRSAYDKDDDPDSDRCDNATARCREDMFEKMLETHALSSLMSRMMNPSSTFASSSTSGGPAGASDHDRSVANRRSTGNKIEVTSRKTEAGGDDDGFTQSEEDLLLECGRHSEPRNKGSLYKSFSASDVFSLSEALLFRVHSSLTTAAPISAQQSRTKMKSCASQSWLPPNDYARVSERRRSHLEYLKRVCTTGTIVDDEWNLLCKEDFIGGRGDDEGDQQHGQDGEGAHTPDTSSGPPTMTTAQQQKNWKKRSSAVITSSSTAKHGSGSGGGDNWRSNSEETVNSEALESKAIASSKQILMKKLNCSKQIRSQIRDDLMNKISKHHKMSQQHNAAVTRSDLEREKGRPLTRLERNFIIFHWLQSLDEDSL